MKIEEKVKLEIEKLKHEIDLLKFEINGINMYYLGTIALLVATFIPTIISIRNLYLTLILGTAFFFLLKKPYNKLYPSLKSNQEKINTKNQKINELYKKLGIK